MKFKILSIFILSSLVYGSAASSSNVEATGGEPSWGLRLLQISDESGEDLLICQQKILSEAKDRVWTKADFDLAPPPAANFFKDPRLGKAASQIREHLQSTLDYIFDEYSFLVYIQTEAKIGRRLHEISSLFLRGAKLKNHEDWFKLQIVFNVNNLIVLQAGWESLLKLQNNQSGLDDFASNMIGNLFAYLKARKENLRTQQRNTPMMFQDVSSRYRLVDQHMVECNRFRFEQQVLMVKFLFEVNNSRCEEGSELYNFLKEFPSLGAFLKGQEKILKDADSYIEENCWELFVHHWGILGKDEGFILKKLIDHTKPVVASHGEQAPSRQQRRLEERMLKKTLKKVVAANVSKDIIKTLYIEEVVKFHRVHFAELVAEQQKDRELLRQEREAQKAATDKRTAELHAALEANAAARAADSPPFVATMAAAASSASSCNLSSSTHTAAEEPTSHMPKAKIKTRGTPDASKAEKDEDETVEEEVFPVFEASKNLFDLYHQLMGPYFAKFGWEKLERLATAFGMEITTPGHGGDHRGLKYKGIEGSTQAISMPVRAAYGPRFFTMIRNFFVHDCHLDEAHVQLEGS